MRKSSVCGITMYGIFVLLEENMAKPFKSTTDQVDLLKTRGLKFEDESEAQIYLLRYNYYNVVNCYSKFLEDFCDHYIPGSSFEEIMAIHNFDSEVKNILMKNVLFFETYFKSILAYTFSENTIGQTNPYLDLRNYDTSTKSKKDAAVDIVDKLKKVISYEKKRANSAIFHYSHKHHEIPLWVLVNFMTFGQAVTVFKCCNKSIQHKITYSLNNFININLGLSTVRLSEKQLILIISNIKDIRNVLAHDNKLLGYESRDSLPFIKEIYNLCTDSNLDSRKDIYSHIRIMRLFLNEGQYNTMINSLIKRIKNLDKKIRTIDYNLITYSLGFPTDFCAQNKK